MERALIAQDPVADDDKTDMADFDSPERTGW
jgi:hypothetical protein